MSTAASAGTVIEGKYRLERELGAGGMGSVWLATQLMVDRNVAVKLLHPAFIDSDDIQARFEVEAKAIGRLHHPNCITLFDFGFSDDLNAFYTVIEYIDGESLDKRLNKRLPLKEIVATIRQIAMALGHAHHQGILHRDLKPENVMISTMTDGSEMVKVLDFGIARIVKGDAEPGSDQTEQQRLTKAGEVFGTPAYMSPEQARSTRSLTPAADLYSLGVMFYELVDGGLPFFANSAFDLLMMHVTKPVPPIERADVPEDLKRLIYKLLEKEPEKRFQSGPELITALDALELPDKANGEVLDDDFEAGPTRITPPPSSPLTPVPASVGDRSGEFSAPNAAQRPPSSPTLAGSPDGSGPLPPASASGSFAADTSGGFPADASGGFPDRSGSFASASGSFPADTSGAFGNNPNYGPKTTTGPIDVSRKRRLVAASLIAFLIFTVIGAIIVVALFDNGDAAADPALESTEEVDPFASDEPSFDPAERPSDEEVEFAAGTEDDSKNDAKNDATPEDEEEDIQPEDVQNTAAEPKETTAVDVEPAPKPKPERKRPTRVRRTTRPKRTAPAPDPPKEKNIIELSLDEEEDEKNGGEVEELSLD